MKILIADDERHIRNGLKMSMDWERLKIDGIFTAENGEEALALCRREKPEIILTDIRMPGMDGLELAKKATELYGAKKVLIMSGYSEFAYAQSAVRIGAVDYLLKPIKLNELEKILENTVAQIAEEEKRQELFDQDILQKLVLGKMSVEEAERKIPETYRNAGEIFCVILRAERVYAGRPEHEMRAMFPAVSAGLERRGFRILLEKVNEAVYMWKAADYQQRSMYRSLLLSSLGGVCQADSQWSAGVSQIGSFRDIYTLYRQAEESLAYRMARDRERIIFYEDISHVPDSVQVFFPWEKIKEQISGLQTEDIQQNIARAFQRFRDSGCIDRRNIQEFCITYKNLLLDVLEGKGIAAGRILEKNAEYFEKQLDYDVLESYERWLCDCCGLILKGVSDVTAKQYSAAVRKAVAYIQEFYGKDITLAEVAEDVQKSANYFSYIFKRDTGMNFNEYLNTVRIGKAKELLKEPEYMAYEIAEMVGYHDYAYFSRVFKKLCGCSPSEYKEGKGTS